MSFGIPVRNGLAVGLLSSTFLSSRRAGGPFSGASLYLNMLTGTLDSRVTFSRGGNATLVDGTGRIVYAPANLLLRSEEFNDAAWSKVAASVTTNATTAPNGTMTAEKLVENTATSNHFVSQSGGDIGDTETFSVYAKRAERFWMRLVLGSQSAFFNLDDGTVVPSNASTIITPVGDGWYRCSLTRVRDSSSFNLIYTALSSAPSSSYTGDGVSGIFIWGAQRELVTYQTVPGPYVATTSAAYYGPRFDYNPVTLAPLGLLIEEQRTNLSLYSEDFTNAYRLSQDVTIVANSTTSPSGVVNADTIIPTTTLTSVHRTFVNPGIGAGAHSVSLYAKTSGYSWLKLRLGSLYANFNVSTGVAGVTAAGVTSTITNVGNGWYRCTMTGTALAGDSLFISPMTTDNAAVDPVAYAGNGVSGIFIWGEQLEAGSFATSYIPTVASQVTRLADVATMTGTNFSSWYNASEGTFFASYEASPNTFTTYLAASNGVVAQNSMHMDNDGAGNMRAAYYSGSSAVALLGLGPVGTIGALNRVSTAYKVNDFAASRNGAAAVVDTLGAVPVGVNRLNIGADPSGAAVNVSNTHIREIAYFNTRLPNAQLEALTAPPLITSLSLDFLNGVYEG